MKAHNRQWLEKEIKKDKEDVSLHKQKLIKEILKTSKSEISKGPQKIENKWIRRIKKILGLYNS